MSSRGKRAPKNDHRIQTTLRAFHFRGPTASGPDHLHGQEPLDHRARPLPTPRRAAIDSDGAASEHATSEYSATDSAHDAMETVPYDPRTGGRIVIDGFDYGRSIIAMENVRTGRYDAADIRHLFEALASMLPHIATHGDVGRLLETFGHDVRGYVAQMIGTAMHMTTDHLEARQQAVAQDMLETSQQQSLVIYDALRNVSQSNAEQFALAQQAVMQIEQTATLDRQQVELRLASLGDTVRDRINAVVAQYNDRVDAIDTKFEALDQSVISRLRNMSEQAQTHHNALRFHAETVATTAANEAAAGTLALANATIEASARRQAASIESTAARLTAALTNQQQATAMDVATLTAMQQSTQQLMDALRDDTHTVMRAAGQAARQMLDTHVRDTDSRILQHQRDTTDAIDAQRHATDARIDVVRADVQGQLVASNMTQRAYTDGALAAADGRAQERAYSAASAAFEASVGVAQAYTDTATAELRAKCDEDNAVNRAAIQSAEARAKADARTQGARAIVMAIDTSTSTLGQLQHVVHGELDRQQQEIHAIRTKVAAAMATAEGAAGAVTRLINKRALEDDELDQNATRLLRLEQSLALITADIAKVSAGMSDGAAKRSVDALRDVVAKLDARITHIEKDLLRNASTDQRDRVSQARAFGDAGVTTRDASRDSASVPPPRQQGTMPKAPRAFAQAPVTATLSSAGPMVSQAAPQTCGAPPMADPGSASPEARAPRPAAADNGTDDVVAIDTAPPTGRQAQPDAATLQAIFDTFQQLQRQSAPAAPAASAAPAAPAAPAAQTPPDAWSVVLKLLGVDTVKQSALGLVPAIAGSHDDPHDAMAMLARTRVVEKRSDHGFVLGLMMDPDGAYAVPDAQTPHITGTTILAGAIFTPVQYMKALDAQVAEIFAAVPRRPKIQPDDHKRIVRSFQELQRALSRAIHGHDMGTLERVPHYNPVPLHEPSAGLPTTQRARTYTDASPFTCVDECVETWRCVREHRRLVADIFVELCHGAGWHDTASTLRSRAAAQSATDIVAPNALTALNPIVIITEESEKRGGSRGGRQSRERRSSPTSSRSPTPRPSGRSRRKPAPKPGPKQQTASPAATATPAAPTTQRGSGGPAPP